MDELTNNITTNTDYLKHHISDKNRVKILENNIGILNKLCSCLNPYKDITDEQKKLLEKFHIHDFHDPFAVTNKLLVILEDFVEEYRGLKEINN